jgi:predicted flap endonuclease-1-like 5' DNA nuclease
MMTVIDANIVPIIIALVVGFIIGWWMFSRARSGGNKVRLNSETRTDQVEAEIQRLRRSLCGPICAPRPIRDGIDTEEGRGLGTGGAAAMTDVAGEVFGVAAHDELPGSSAPPDDLQLLKGVGPKLAQKLNENGITRFEQVARLSPNEVAILDERLGPFRGRIERDRVVEQASYLARGDRDGFEARFGKLGGA